VTLRREVLVKTDVSEECIASIIRVTIVELGTTSAVNSNRSTFLRSMLQLLVTAEVPSSLILVSMMMEAIRSSETSVLTRSTLRNIPEDGILDVQHSSVPAKSFSPTLLEGRCPIQFSEHQEVHICKTPRVNDITAASTVWTNMGVLILAPV
jgi:hypothetical protein